MIRFLRSLITRPFEERIARLEAEKEQLRVKVRELTALLVDAERAGVEAGLFDIEECSFYKPIGEQRTLRPRRRERFQA